MGATGGSSAGGLGEIAGKTALAATCHKTALAASCQWHPCLRLELWHPSSRMVRSRAGRTLLTLLVAFVLAIAGRVQVTHAQCTANQLAKLLANDGASSAHFGFSVSIDGDVAIIGADGDDDGGTNVGSAYIFRFDGTSWNQQAKLLASDGQAGDAFGTAVSINADVVIVGAILDDDNGDRSGSAYIFRFDGTSWNQEAKLLASDGAPADQFGNAVSINGDAAIVGADLDDDLGTFSGTAFIFRFDGTNWNQEAKLLASDGAARDEFGFSVSIDGNNALIGARLDDDNGSGSGSAYVFRFDGTNWNQEAKLLASDGAAGDDFGTSVSLSSDVAILGANGVDDNGSKSGAAYVFRFDGTNWNQEAKLLASDGAADDDLGISVSIDADVAIVGADGDDDSGTDAGSAFVFRFDGTSWNELAKLLASDGADKDSFGSSVSVSGNVAFTGAFQDDDKGSGSGSVSVFADLDDCNNNGTLDSCDIADGTSQDCNGNGVPDECDIANGTSQDCNGNGIPDECETDCNGNGVPDDCDIANGTSKDCNNDGIPDECQLGDNDCNDNGVPDDCDIANGTSQDQNGNGIPDECEGGCTGNEKIKKPKGKTKCKNGVVKKLTILVKLIKGNPGDTFTVSLDNGLTKDGTIKESGSGKATFKSKKCKDFSPGDFTATATWGCGATASKDGTVPQDCPCP